MGETIEEDVAALMVFVDELPSLFATDDGDANSSSDIPYFASAQPLSADKLGEFLRSIDADEQQPEQQAQLMQTQEQPQQVLQPGWKAPVAPKKKKKANKLSNKARDSRKEEILYLHKTVLELETRLGLLKINKSSATQTLSNYSVDNGREAASRSLIPTITAAQNGGGQDTELPEVWREIARHQCDERDRSERENIRLRLVLESQLKVARSLEKFLVFKAAASSMDISKSIDLQRYSQLAQSSDLSSHGLDAAIFHDLLVGVEQMLAEVDAVYEANGLARVETTQISAQTRFDTERNAMRIEVCASKMLPFSVHETGAAVWNHYVYAKRRMPSRYYFYHSYKSIDETEDTIVEDFSVELHSKNKRGSFRMRQVTRRLVQDDRVVIVWRSYTDPLEFSERPLSGLRSLEKGYIVVRKSSSGASRPSVTLLQPCHIMYPCASLEGCAITSDTVVGAITDFRMSATTDFVASTYQMVENVLVEQALKRSPDQELSQ